MKDQVDKLVKVIKRERKKVVFLTVLLVFFFYLVIPLMSGSDQEETQTAGTRSEKKKKKKSDTKQSTDSEDVSKEAGESQYPVFLIEPVKADLLAGNPFLPLGMNSGAMGQSGRKGRMRMGSSYPGSEMEEIKKMNVASTLLGEISTCVVDGEVLRVGSEYKGFVVKEIGSQYVVFTSSFGEYRATIQSPVKKIVRIVDK